MDKWRWIRISLVLATLGGLHLPCAAVLAGQLSNASCYGDGQMSVYWSSHTLTGDAEYYNVTVTGTLNTNGYTLRVRGALTNYGTITDLSGAAGGSGGTGATGGHVGTYPTYHEPCCCTPGESGNPASCAGGGHGGSGGGGGGGGGGSEHRIAGDCWQNGGATGGNGGNGGAGGRGGGCVTIYAYNLNNQGIITADGGDGQAGSNGTEGDLRTYYCSLAWRDASGGGGGGGGGGNGGDAGSVKVYYAHLVERGEISAHGGAGGNGGTKGGSRCAELQHNPAPAQVFHYGSPGCTSGDGECGSGGAGGESDCGTSCGPTAHGYDGSNGCPGENGAVLVIQDCNCNGVADQIDIAFGTSEDCQPNGIPDECELDSFHVISSQLSPVGVGSPQSYTLCHPPEALGTVALIFRASADLAESDEYIDVDLDGMAVGRIFEGGAHESDCPAGSDGDWLSVSRATFNAARAGGGIVINLTASAAVDPDQCTPSWIDVVVTYEADNDQDADGVPDPCSIAWFSAREIDLFQDTFDTTTCAHNALCQNQELPKMVLATEESLNVHVLAPGGLASPSSWVRLRYSIDRGKTWKDNDMVASTPDSCDPEIGGTFTASICPGEVGQGDSWLRGTEVWYYVEVKDDLGRLAYWPASAAPDSPPIPFPESLYKTNYLEFSILPGPGGSWDGLRVLLVDDFGGRDFDFHECYQETTLVETEDFYESALLQLNYYYDKYDVNSPDDSLASEPWGFIADGDPMTRLYDAVIWFTSRARRHTVTDPTQQRLIDFVRNGGHLFICGNHIGADLAYPDTSDFYGGLLGSRFLHESPGGGQRPFYDAIGASGCGSALTSTDMFQFHLGPPVNESHDCVAVNESPPFWSAPGPYLAYPEGWVFADSFVAICNETDGGKVVYMNFDLAMMGDHMPSCPYENRVDLLRDVLGVVFQMPTAVGEDSRQGHVCALEQNHPNPFNPDTDIRFSIRDQGKVGLRVYNVRGQVVKTLVNQVMNAGQHSVHWDGTSDSGQPVSSGIYFCKMEIEGFRATRKMILLK